MAAQIAERQGRSYVPLEVIQGLYPECQIALSYDVSNRAILLVYRPERIAQTTRDGALAAQDQVRGAGQRQGREDVTPPSQH